ncbi:MAG: CRISPR system precrRNA processing endoribonuclease RAMP protein Cas6 [Candidatus Heimdallarchaeaceae archaeon]
MSTKLDRLLKIDILQIELKIKTSKNLTIPYCGPVLRNWIKSKLYGAEKKYGKEESSNCPFEPYFYFVKQEKNDIRVNLRLPEGNEKKAEEIIKRVTRKKKLHVNGIEATIEEIRMEKIKLQEKKEFNKIIEVNFVTPTNISSKNKMKLFIQLNDILSALIRSTNRYNKFYMKKFYPIKWKKEWENEQTKIKEYNLKTFEWWQKRKKGKKIRLEGVRGKIVYEAKEKIEEEMRKTIDLANFYQIGKRIAYGFGKIEFRKLKP